MNNKNFWKRGGAEIVGFLCTTPFIIFIFAMLVSIIQTGTIKEQLEYITYEACRQVVVCTDSNDNGDYQDDAEKTALKYAKKKVKQITKADIDTLEVSVELVKDDNGNTPDWVKGSYVRCSVSVYVTAPLEIMSGQKTSTIVMMIEYPANTGGDYPWFNDL